MLESYIFDLDGTLVDSQAGVAWAASEAVARVEPHLALPDLRTYIGPQIHDVFARALNLNDPARIAALVSEYRGLYDEGGYRKASIYEGVEATLMELRARGSRCFVVTNKPTLPTARMLVHLNLSHFFIALISPDAPGGPFEDKGDALGALLAAHQLEAASSLFVGDSLDDARAAATHSIRFVAAAYGYGKADEQKEWPVTYVIHRFQQLLAIEEESANLRQVT